MSTSAFEGYPVGDHRDPCAGAVSILRSAHDAASHLIELFDIFSESEILSEHADGTEWLVQSQELLRAMLTLASSGLDAMIKQLVRDALPEVIDLRPGAQEQFRRFVERRLKRDGAPDYSFVADVIATREPRSRLTDEMVGRLTDRSLQSVEEILRVGSYFDIPSKDLIPDPDAVREVFAKRNQIVHEMDFDSATGDRRQRQSRDMRADTQELFTIADRFLTKVADRLSPAAHDAPEE